MSSKQFVEVLKYLYRIIFYIFANFQLYDYANFQKFANIYRYSTEMFMKGHKQYLRQTGKTGMLQYMGSQRVGYWATKQQQQQQKYSNKVQIYDNHCQFVKIFIKVSQI